MYSENVFAKLIALGMDTGLVLCLPLLLVGIALLIGSIAYVRAHDQKTSTFISVFLGEWVYFVILVCAKQVIMSL